MRKFASLFFVWHLIFRASGHFRALPGWFLYVLCKKNHSPEGEDCRFYRSDISHSQSLNMMLAVAPFLGRIG